MNITNDIQFDTNLIGNETANLKYNGYLYKNGSDSVTLVYGYDDDWKNTSEKIMTKTDDGFVCKINVYNFSSLKFCFKNSNGDWDNNFGNNYSTPIQRRKTSHKFIINESYLPSILDELIENTSSTKINDNQNDSISSEERNKIKNIVENYADIHNDNANIIDNLMNITSSTIKKYDWSKNELIRLSNSLQKSIREYREFESEEITKIELEKQLNEDISAPVSKAASLEDYVESSDFDMDSLVDSLLSPVIEERNIAKDDVKYFDIDKLVDSYYHTFKTEENAAAPSFDMNTVQFNKITVSEEEPEAVAELVDQEAAQKEDIAKKKILLSEIDALFDELNLNIEENSQETANADRLYELSTGITKEENLKEVNELISETEETIKNIQTLFDEIHSINDDTSNVNISTEEEIQDNAIKYIVSEDTPVQENVPSQEEVSLFNEYENDSNKMPNYIPGVDNDINDLYDEEETYASAEKQSEEDENKFLVVSTRSLSMSKRITNKIKTPFLKLRKIISAVFDNLFS
ncbi:MAG: hypothetical protein K6D97_03135 [Clostridia bacterium]|nr:hypothetical protein [Clostridia bacterium]